MCAKFQGLPPKTAWELASSGIWCGRHDPARTHVCRKPVQQHPTDDSQSTFPGSQCAVDNEIRPSSRIRGAVTGGSQHGDVDVHQNVRRKNTPTRSLTPVRARPSASATAAAPSGGLNSTKFPSSTTCRPPRSHPPRDKRVG